MVARATLVSLLATAGCTPAIVTPRPGDAPPSPRPELATDYDAAKCGTLAGRVTFEGQRPDVPKLLGALPENDGYAWVTKPNPFAPRVGPGKGLADVFVWLEGVDPARSKPWPGGNLGIEIRDAEFRANGEPFVAGVVRTGESLKVTSRDAAFHSLRARGVAFFSLPFPSVNSTVTRELPRPGFVELSCATTAYWMNANVLVSDTPYATVTDRDGRYQLDNVPDGNYTLHIRAQNWNVTRTERDPESGLHARQYYAHPAEKKDAIVINAATKMNRSVTFVAADFPGAE